MNPIDDEFREWDASYLLGMLSPEDRRAYERHLSTCDACTAAVAELAGLPGILSTLSVDEATELGTETDAATLHDSAREPGPVQRLAAITFLQRRRRRWALGVSSGLVALSLAAAAFFVGFALHAPSTPPDAIAMTPVVANAITADLTVTPKKWGTRFDWACSYAASRGTGPDVDYDLVVTENDGTQVTVATWGAYGDTAKNLSASTAVATDDIRSVDIREAGASTVLARANL